MRDNRFIKTAKSRKSQIKILNKLYKSLPLISCYFINAALRIYSRPFYNNRNQGFGKQFIQLIHKFSVNISFKIP